MVDSNCRECTNGILISFLPKWGKACDSNSVPWLSFIDDNWINSINRTSCFVPNYLHSARILPNWTVCALSIRNDLFTLLMEGGRRCGKITNFFGQRFSRVSILDCLSLQISLGVNGSYGFGQSGILAKAYISKRCTLTLMLKAALSLTNSVWTNSNAFHTETPLYGVALS